MAKRFADSERFKKQRWYRLLDPYYKIAWEYINAQCDGAGMWQINCADLIDDLRLPSFDINKFVESCNMDYDPLTGQPIVKDRLRFHSKTLLWITTYIKEQHDGRTGFVNPNDLFAKAAIMKLSEHGRLCEALRRAYIPLTIPIEPLSKLYLTPSKGDGIPFEGGQERDMVKEKEMTLAIYGSRDSGENKGGKGGKGGGPLNVVHVAPPTAPTEVASGADSGSNPYADHESRLKEDQKFIEALMTTREIKSKEDLEKWLMEFHIHLITEESTHVEYKDYKRHFKNWIIKQPTADGPPQPRSNGTAKRRNHSGGSNRVTAATLEKYKQA